jgi:hypothetical protein
MTTTNYFRYTLVPIFEDETYETVIGWDVMEPGSHPDDEPIAEMVVDIDAAKAAVREDRKYRKFCRQFGISR